MFYIKSFLNIFKSHFILISFNALLFLSFAMTLSYNNKITDFFSLDSKTNRTPYFNALISGDHDLKYIERKIQKLPGVEHVEFKKTLDAKKEMARILPATSLADVFENSSYRPLKIFLNSQVKKSSRELIREYLSRLIGKESVTFSTVKYPAKINLKKHPYFKIFSNWSGLYFSFLLFSLWMIATILVSPYFHQQAFIIEKFQRKKGVATKMFIGFVFSLSSVIIFNVITGGRNIGMTEFTIFLAGIIISIVTFNFAKLSSRKIL